MASDTIVTNEKGAPAYSEEGLAQRLQEMGVRGGPLVALNGEIVGPRRPGQNGRAPTQGGTERPRLTSMIESCLQEVKSMDTETRKAQIVDLFVLCFDVGAVREGRGERSLFNWYFLKLYEMWPQTCLHLLPQIPEYASWRQLNQLYEQAYLDQKEFAKDFSSLLDGIVKVYKDQLEKDSRDIEAKSNASISLAGKWAPTLRSMYDKSCGLGKALCSALFPPQGDASSTGARRWMEKQYRHLLSRLRNQLDVTERKMTGKRWAEIEPEHVASICNRKNRHALQNVVAPRNRKPGQDIVRCPDDPDRVECAENYEAAIKRSLEGKTSKRIKGSANQPHELVGQYLKSGSEEDRLIEAMWVDLKKKLTENGNFKPGIPLVDVSGSMSGLPMQVSIALGILMAQLLPDPWHGKMITFESNPQLCSIAHCETLYQAVRETAALPWGGSTDFSAALDLVLRLARQNGLSSEQLPETMFVFSDMEFDCATRNPGAVMGPEIKRRFQSAGYDHAPHIVFWNLRASGTPTFQADAAESGVSIMSGFSQQILKDFLEEGVLKNGKQITPLESLFTRLNKPGFQPIRDLCVEELKLPD